jgi:hypothetical protein
MGQFGGGSGSDPFIDPNSGTDYSKYRVKAGDTQNGGNVVTERMAREHDQHLIRNAHNTDPGFFGNPPPMGGGISLGGGMMAMGGGGGMAGRPLYMGGATGGDRFADRMWNDLQAPGVKAGSTFNYVNGQLVNTNVPGLMSNAQPGGTVAGAPVMGLRPQSGMPQTLASPMMMLDQGAQGDLTQAMRDMSRITGSQANAGYNTAQGVSSAQLGLQGQINSANDQMGRLQQGIGYQNQMSRMGSQNQMQQSQLMQQLYGPLMSTMYGDAGVSF